MSRISAADSLLAQLWQSAISSLRSNLGEEHLPTLISTWSASALLGADLSPNEPEIRDYLTLLDNWIEQLDAKVKVLDESSTGLLGLWIYLRRHRRKRVSDCLESLFLRSLEHNFQKPKELTLGTSVDLLAAAAAGLGSISSSAELRARTSEHLQALVQNADALEVVQLLQSWELIQRTGDIPHMDVQHRLESIAAENDRSVIERAMAYYGQFRLAELFGTPKIEYELRFLNCLGVAASPNRGESISMVKPYVLSLPYLRERMSFKSLYDAWQRYTDSSYKRAKAECYWARYLFIVCLVAAALVTYLPWLRQLDVGFIVSISAAIVATLLWLTVLTVEVTAELYGHQFWQRGKWEIFILLLGALVGIIAALVEASLK